MSMVDVRTDSVQDLPNLSMVAKFSVATRLQVLDKNGDECGPAQFSQTTEKDINQLRSVEEKLAQRDWRDLRKKLINLDLDNHQQIAEWLTQAGYVPKPEELDELKLARTISPGAESLEKARTMAEATAIEPNLYEWPESAVTNEIVAWLQSWRDVVRWLMDIKTERFRSAVNAAFALDEDMRVTYGIALQAAFEDREVKGLKHPVTDFLRALKPPAYVDTKTLAACLTGVGRGERLPAYFQWNADGKPSVTVHIDTPARAIVMAVHVDKNFSVRHWRTCDNCGAGFEAERGTHRFCSNRCTNYFTTNARRDKLRVLSEGDQEWQRLPAEKRKKFDRWEWISGWAKRNHDTQIDPAWARKCVTKGETA